METTRVRGAEERSQARAERRLPSLIRQQEAPKGLEGRALPRGQGHRGGQSSRWRGKRHKDQASTAGTSPTAREAPRRNMEWGS